MGTSAVVGLFGAVLGLSACQPTGEWAAPGAGPGRAARQVSGVALDSSWWRVAAKPVGHDPTAWVNSHPRHRGAIALAHAERIMARRQALSTQTRWNIPESGPIDSTAALFVAAETTDNATDRLVIEGSGSPAHYIGVVSNVYGPGAPVVTKSPAIDSAIDGSAITLSLDGTLAYAVTGGGRVYAVKLSDATFAWGPVSLGSAVSWSTPWLDYNTNVLYFADLSGNITALDAATGTVAWQATNITGTGAGIHSSPLSWNGVVWVGADDGKLYRLDAVSGALIGAGTTLCLSSASCTTADQIWSSAFLDVDNNVLLIGANKRLIQINMASCASAASGCSFSAFPIDEGAFQSARAIYRSFPYYDSGSGFVYVTFDNRLWRIPYAAGVSGSFSRASTVATSSDPTGVMRSWSQNDHTRPKSSPLVFNGVVFIGDGGGAMNRFDVGSWSQLARLDFSNTSAVPVANYPAIDSTPLIDVFGGNLYFGTRNPNAPQGNWVSLPQGFSTETATAGSAVKLWVSATAGATAGTPFDVTVVALDQFNNVATSYRGTIAFSATDGSATKPGNYAFTAADNGVHTFSGGVTLRTAGTQTLTLSDTVNGSISTTWPVLVTGSAAASFTVTSSTGAPSACTAFTVTVTARDAIGNVASGYTGTVHFTSTDLAMGVLLPADYTFTAADAGVHTFNVTLRTNGTQSVTATDTANMMLTGSRTGLTVSNPAASLSLTAVPTSATAGTAFTFGVTALDACGSTATGYSGTVKITSSDALATLPPNQNLAAGVKTGINATLRTAGLQTLTATDTTTPSVTGTSSVTVNAGALAGFQVSAPAAATAGVAFSVTVAAVDANGNIVTGYTGTVSFTSSDGNATLPSSYTFVAGDNGIHTFPSGVTLRTVNKNGQSITASGSGQTGTATVTVSSGALSRFGFTTPAGAAAGLPFSFTLAAQDTNGNTIPTYAGTVHFTTTDPAMGVLLPADYTFTAADQGVHVFSATLVSLGNQRLQATAGAISNESSNINIQNGVGTTMTLTASRSSGIAGDLFTLTAVVYDQFGNVAKGYTGTVHFTSTDASAVLPADYTFTNADNGTHAWNNGAQLMTAGTWTVTATDTVKPMLNATTSPITIGIGPLDHFAVSAPASAQVNVPFGVTVAAKDLGGNTIPTYAGTIQFQPPVGGGGMNPTGVYPADYTFVAGDAGAHTFTAGVTINVTGSQTFWVRDSASKLKAGSATVNVTSAPTAKLAISASTSTPTAGTSFTITVTAKDAFNNTATGYLGTVSFSSSDGLAELPTSYIFQPGDAGVHTFTVTTKTAGAHTVGATDTVTPSITGSVGVTTDPAVPTSMTVNFPATVTANVAASMTVTTFDTYGNVATAASSVTVTSTDPMVASLSRNLISGTRTFNYTLQTLGQQTITVTNTTFPALVTQVVTQVQ